jgi:6-phosphogluconolactonase (cycloisomerase 2 family)
MHGRRPALVVALSLLATLLLAPPALADRGDVTNQGCLRDLDNVSTGCTAAQGLDRAYGVVVSGDGKQAYVASADDDTLTTFSRDTTTGALTWVGCLRDSTRAANGCTSAAGLDGARGIAISDDGASVYVASGEGDALAVLQRNTTSGALTWSSCFRDTENALGGCTKAQGLDDPRDVSVSSNGQSVYVASATDDAVAIFGRSLLTLGTLTWQSCVRDVDNPGPGCAAAAGLDGPRAAEVSDDGRSVYVAARDGDSVATFDRSALTGSLTWTGCFRDVENLTPGCTAVQGLDGPHGIALSPDGASVYFPTESDDTVTTFARNTTSGTLTYGGCIRDIGSVTGGGGCTTVDGLNGARQVDVSPDGESVYVAGADDDALVVFDRDATTGALAWDSCVRDLERVASGCTLAQGLDGVRGVTVSPDGRSLYAASEVDDAVVVFGRETDAPPPADTTAPAVSWTAPAANQVVSGALSQGAGSCNVTATDAVGVDRVELLLDGAALATDTTAPYGCEWDTTTVGDGPHTLTARAFDLAGNSAQANRTVTVDNVVEPPTVTITSPAAGATFTQKLAFSATAADDVGVVRVEFYVDGDLKVSDTSAPYSGSWTANKKVPYGTHTLTAKAIDARGLSTSTSIGVTRVP